MFECIQCVVLTFLVIFCVQISGQQEAGDPCRTSTGSSGTCKFLTECPAALDEIRRGRYPKDICGFLGTQSIVCCSGAAPDTISRPQTPTPSRMTPTRPTTTRATTPISRPTTPRTTQKRKPIASNGKVGDVATRMCESYAKYAYEVSKDPGLALFSEGNVEELICPFEKEALIVGGRKASPREFPHMAQIGYITGPETSWSCGGTLISKNFVLTAGHCMDDAELGTPKLIRAGITNLTDLRESQMRKVKNLYTHPEYTIYKYNDIGLIEVVSDFDMNTYVRPACIYTQKDFPVSNAIASGWGRVNYAGDDSRDLLKVVLELFSTPKCNSTYRRDILEVGTALPNGIMEDVMVCAGSTKEFRDTCQGDSGGPLQIYHKETAEIKCMYDIIGVTSFGKACGLAKNVPGVYTRVSAYTKWIEDTVWLR